jgi:hypothetical protein
MGQDQRLEALKAKHHALEETIVQKSTSHMDDLEISALKKEKLRIKDEMAALARH